VPGHQSKNQKRLSLAPASEFNRIVVESKGIEMHDFRLVAARRLRFNENAWQDQGHLWLVIHTLKQIVADVTETVVARAEAEMLIKKLYIAGKRPAFK